MAGLEQGYISAIDYAAGKATVVFKDRDQKVSQYLPFLNAEYYPYKVDDLVYVLTLDNCKEYGVILGTIWTQKNPPPEGKEGLWYKDLSREKGKCKIRYDDGTGELSIQCSEKLKLTVTGDAEITAAGGDVVINGISLLNHTHTCPDGETSKPK